MSGSTHKSNARGEPWRLRCPDGHASWRRCGQDYVCDMCGRFGALVDIKTGQEFQR